MANIFHVERAANKITLGTVNTTINIASHTASKLLALDASKDLTSTIEPSTDGTLGDNSDLAIPTEKAVKTYVDGLGAGYQPLDAGLTSLAGLTVVSDSFIKATATDIYAIRTIAETKTDLSLNLVENTALSTWAGSGNITTIGALAAGSIAAGFTEIAVDYTAAKCTDATADNTAGNETSHADVLVDGDFGSAGLMNTDGAGSYSIKVIGTDVQAQHANLASLAGLTYAAAAFVKMTGANTFALRTIGDVADDLEATIDHDNLANTHDLTTDIDHDTITNNHNLTTDIDHDSITNGGAHDYSYITGNDGATDVSAAELEELTDGSETTLHSHAADGGAPVGSMIIWTTDTAPTGWLLCYGQAVSRTVTYDGLFAVIGTTFGVGDGSTTFNLPDMRGRFPLGQDDMGGASANRVTHANADSIGGVEGAETHTLTKTEMPAHTHTIDAGHVLDGSGQVETTGASGVTENTNSTGGGGAHNNMSPYITLNYIIKY